MRPTKHYIIYVKSYGGIIFTIDPTYSPLMEKIM